MRYGTHTLAIPNNAEYSVPQLKILLKGSGTDYGKEDFLVGVAKSFLRN